MITAIKQFFSSVHGILICIAALCLIGMAMDSLVIESVTFKQVDSKEPAVEISPPYIRRDNNHYLATINVYYRGKGNTILRLTPRYCFYKGFRINDVAHDFSNNEQQECGELFIDLRPDVHEGLNTLTIDTGPRPNKPEEYSPNVGLAVGQPLYGMNQSLDTYTATLVSCFLTLIWLWLSKQKFSGLTCSIFIVGCGFFLEGLHKMPQFSYSLDLEKHIAYMSYMSEHFFEPHNYRGPESWHPPVYYMASALIAKLFGATGIIDMWTGVRLFSLTCYATFMYFGLKTLDRLFHGLPFYLALSLMMFWPSGFFSSAWAFNDALVYPLYAACFYFTLLWYERDETRSLFWALIIAGLAFTVKTTALVPTGILGTCILVRLYLRHISLRTLLAKELRLAWVILAFGISCNFGGIVYDKFISHDPIPPHLGGDGDFIPSVDHLLLINVRELLTQPYFNSWEDPALWNITIKTMLFTNAYWQHPVIGSLLIALLLLMMTYNVVFLLTLGRERLLAIFPVVSGFFLPFAALLAFVFACGIGACVDFRYIQPALVSIVAIFCLAVSEAKRHDRLLLYYGGNLIGFAFPLCSILFFYLQMR